MAKNKHIYDWQELAFCAALLERLYPNYYLFCESYQLLGPSAIYRNILDICWQYIAGDSIKIDFEKQQLKLEEIFPDLNQHGGFGAMLAQDACVGLMSLLEMCEGQEGLTKGVFVRLYVSGIHQYLELTDEQASLEEHELVEDSKAYAAMLDDSLENLARPSLKTLIKEVQSIGVSNIGVSLQEDY